MNIEDEVFDKYTIDIEKLKEYGFQKEGKKLLYRTNIMNDKFTVVLEYDKKIQGKIIELEFDDEYTNFRREILGEFHAQVKQEFIQVLKDIRNECCIRNDFHFSQTIRINKYFQQKYHVSPEFLWDKYPSFAVYRQTKKWFALIGYIPYQKVDKTSNRNDMIEVINVKVAEDEIDKFLSKKGYYEAYHMNKRNWISIILDDTLSDKDVIYMIDKSYNLVNEAVDWLIPSNPKYFDIVKAFDENDEIIWKQSSDIQIGDIVYIYVAEPYSKILYKTVATEVDIPYEYHDKNLKMNRVMKIKLLKKYDKENYSFSYLNQLGIKAIRGPRKISKDISCFIK